MDGSNRLEKPVVIRAGFRGFFDYYFHPERKGEYMSAFTEETPAFFLLGYTKDVKKEGRSRDSGELTFHGEEEMFFHSMDPEDADLYIIRFRPGPMMTEVRAGRSDRVKISDRVYLENHLVLPDPDRCLSRAHFKLFLDRNRADYQNLNPSNTTRHARGREEKAMGPLETVRLEDDDEIRVCAMVLRAKYPFGLWRFMETTGHFLEPAPYGETDDSPLEAGIGQMYSEIARDSNQLQTNIRELPELVDDEDGREK